MQHWLDVGTDGDADSCRGSRSTGSARATTARSCGRATARTAGCSTGCCGGSRATRPPTPCPRRSEGPDAGVVERRGLDLSADTLAERCARRRVVAPGDPPGLQHFTFIASAFRRARRRARRAREAPVALAATTPVNRRGEGIGLDARAEPQARAAPDATTSRRPACQRRFVTHAHRLGGAALAVDAHLDRARTSEHQVHLGRLVAQHQRRLPRRPPAATDRPLAP